MKFSKLSKILFLITLLITSTSFATAQKSLGFEMGVGYPDLTIINTSQKARYSGMSAQGNLLFPILSTGNFSMDLDFLYKYTSVENNSSNSTLSEWAHFTSFGTGLRFNYSYFFIGADYLSARGKHVQAGTANQIFDYKFNTYQWHAGLSLPLSPAASIILAYSQMPKTSIEIQGQSLSLQEQIFSLRLQIDFGISFFNLLNPSDSFAPTRNSFFTN
jgi:hypothetical protein